MSFKILAVVIWLEMLLNVWAYRAQVISYGHCNLTIQYFPSDLEVSWYDTIDDITDNTRNWTRGCEKMMENKSEIMEFLSAAEKREQQHRYEEHQAHRHHIFSRHVYEEKCGQTVTKKVVPIEPLVGFLRHPLHHCILSDGRTINGLDYSVNKSYMLPIFRQEVLPHITGQRIRQRFMFDLGASLYTQGWGGASQQWFVDTYRTHGLEFDRILAWEAAPLNPKDIFDQVPPQVMGKLSYFNVPAEIDPEHRNNPLRILRMITHVEDFVVLKIDIDHDEVEHSFIKQILSDRTISDRVDELFFEHHVSKSPMEHLGWGISKKLNNITESYQMFTNLRALGIRAHSWV